MHARSATPINADPIDALQEVLDGAVQDLRYAQAQVDQLSITEFWRETIAGKMPHEWVRFRDDRREEVAALANSMVRNGIADRAVRVQEARAALMVQMITAAAERAGLNGTQVRALGSALREEITARAATLEAGA